VEQIITFGKVVRPILGISFAPDQSSEQLGVKGEGGLGWGLQHVCSKTQQVGRCIPS
jgi:hypothetical protein